jgi:hypothetical protein
MLTRMARRLTALALALAFGHGVAHAAMETTLPVPLDGVGVARGVVLVRCPTDLPDMARLSRGSVLDLGTDAAAADVVLTTAHGLLDSDPAVQRRCTVHGVHGRPYEIAKVWRAGGAASVATDWAVLLLKQRLEGEVGRLHVGRASGAELAQLAVARAPVRLLLRQAPLDEGDCRLLEARPPYDRRPMSLMVYACELGLSGVPGLSGSPLLVGLHGNALIIGIHTGWGLQTFDDGRLHVVSVGRPIDADIAAAIEAATAAARR